MYGNFASLSDRFGFRNPGPRQFRIGEDDGWNRDIVEFDRFAEQCFDGNFGFSSRLVSQHRFASDVTDCHQLRIGCSLVLVDPDKALFVHDRLRVLQPQTSTIRTTSD